MAALRPTAIRAIHAQRAAFRPSAPAHASIKPDFQTHYDRYTAENVTKWIPSLILWGGAASGAVVLFMSSVPLFQKDVLMKVPIIASYFEDKTPDSDKPF